jgi:hypothetical protein
MNPALKEWPPDCCAESLFVDLDGQLLAMSGQLVEGRCGLSGSRWIRRAEERAAAESSAGSWLPHGGGGSWIVDTRPEG